MMAVVNMMMVPAAATTAPLIPQFLGLIIFNRNIMACPCCNDQGDLVAVIEVAPPPPSPTTVPLQLQQLHRQTPRLNARAETQVKRRSPAPYTRPSIFLLNARW